jgi:hypothetical protein
LGASLLSDAPFIYPRLIASEPCGMMFCVPFTERRL